jgi:hypothetical protein
MCLSVAKYQADSCAADDEIFSARDESVASAFDASRLVSARSSYWVTEGKPPIRRGQPGIFLQPFYRIGRRPAVICMTGYRNR